MAKTIKLFKVHPGELFTLDGVKFVKLGEKLGDTFALTRDVVMGNVPFEDESSRRADHNNYIGSYLKEQCWRWLIDEHPAIFAAVAEHPIDLTTMDGMTDYGTPLTTVRALTIDEYRKYRRFIPLASMNFWLATGWTIRRGVNIVSTRGDVEHSGEFADVGLALRPALYLKPGTRVLADDGEEIKKTVDPAIVGLLRETVELLKKSDSGYREAMRLIEDSVSENYEVAKLLGNLLDKIEEGKV